MKKPNIVLIQADQMSATALKCYGNTITKTPVIDRFAAEGTVFANAYCNFPLCAPSRFSMMTGQLASRIGAYDNGAEFPSSIPTFAHYLRSAGYRTCLSGKMHFIGADQLHGYDERLTSDIYPGDFAWTADWEQRAHRDANGPSAMTITGTCTGSVQLDYDEQVAERACDWIANNADDHDTPFHLTVSFTHPHDPFVCTEEFWNLYEGVDIPLPSTPPATDPHSQAMLRQYGIEDMHFSDEQIISARRGYYGSVSYIDSKIGAVIEALEIAGCMENTVILFTADHGEMLGEHGLWMKKVFFEHSLKVPFIIWSPSLVKPGRFEELTSLVDLLPTMLGFANGDDGDVITPVEPLDGTDLSPAAVEGTAPPDRPLMAEMTCEGTPGPVLLLRQGSIKYIWSAIDPAMMFDLSTDPNEVNNLAGNPDYADIEATMVQEIAERWDAGKLAEDVRLSQVRRLLVQRAHKSHGTAPDWDYVDAHGADDRWMRSNTTYDDWAFGSITGMDD